MCTSWLIWFYNNFIVIIMFQGICDGLEFFVSRWLVCPWGCCFEGDLCDLHCVKFPI